MIPIDRIILIENPNEKGNFLGLGLLYFNYVFTCRHIFNPTENIQETVFSIKFPLANNQKNIEAHTIYSSKESDVVILELLENNNYKSSFYGYPMDLWGHKFRAFGFPNNYDNGVWISGEIQGVQSKGWIQLETTKITGHQVVRGFSGSPVWDETQDDFVGIIVAADKDKLTRVGYMQPITRYHEILEKLNKPLAIGTKTFFGRDAELELLKSWVNDKDIFAITLTGIGGIGKTALIKEFSRTQISKHIWISAADISDFNLEKLSFAYWAQIGPQEMSVNSLEIMMEHLRRNQNIVILDNFETINPEQSIRIVSFIRNLWGPNIKSKFVITTRVPVKELDNWTYSRELKLTKGLSTEDALEFINYLTQNKGMGNLEHKLSVELINASEGHPKVLEILLGIIKRKGKKDIKQIIGKKGGEFTEALDSILRNSFNRLTSEQKNILSYIQFLRTHNFFESEIRAIAQEDKTAEILEQLLDLGVISFDYYLARYSVHQLIIDYSAFTANNYIADENILSIRLCSFYYDALSIKDKSLDEMGVNVENLLALIERLLENEDVLNSGDLILRTCERLEQLGQLNKALYILKQGLTLTEKINVLHYQKAFHYLIGKFAYLINDLVSSQDSFLTFHNLSNDDIDFQHAFALHHLAISLYYPRSVSGEKIFNYLRKCLVYYNKLGMKLYVAYALNDMATQINYYGDKNLTLKWIHSSLRLVETVDLKTDEEKKVAGIIFRATANTFREIEDNAKALYYIEKSIVLHEESKSYWELGHSLYSYAQVLLRLGNLSMAQEILQKQISLINVIGKAGQFSHAYYTLGSIFLSLNQNELAQQEYQKGYELALNLQTTDVSLIYIGDYVLGKLMLNQKRFESAIEHFNKSIELRVSSGQATALPQVYLLLAESYYGVGDLKQTKDTLETFFVLNSRSIYSSASEMQAKAENLLFRISANQKG